MPSMRFDGPVRRRLSSFLALNQIALAAYARRLVGRTIEPTWDVNREIGTLFMRRQFTKAMNAPDMDQGRVLFDSLQLETPDIYDVDRSEETNPPGTWHRPRSRTSSAVILHCHGGGYAFQGGISRRFADMLAHHTGSPVFAPNYRLTPEHPHPAQAEDALAAWRHVTAQASPQKIVVTGDSAGGHMMLMLLLALKTAGLAPPALGIGLCPWTDIGTRGASLSGNDRYDLVQGWMALRFGQWLDPGGRYGREALSPISHDFSGTAPLYLQIGGRDILHDMTDDFARKLAQKGADVMLDAWPHMAHEFQALDSLHADAAEALARISQAVRHAVGEVRSFGPGPRTVTSAGRFSGGQAAVGNA